MFDRFFRKLLVLYFPRHLTYRGLGMAIPLHALQTTVKAIYLLLGVISGFIQASMSIIQGLFKDF